MPKKDTHSRIQTRPNIQFGLPPSPTQQSAYRLYDIGFSVGVLYPASKTPYIWRLLVNARIAREYIPWLYAERRGICVITGGISRNLTALDCETQGEAIYHAREFASRGLHPWVVGTARGKHFWWLSADGEIANVGLKAFPNGQAEIRGNRGYVVAPPSIHPSGFIYKWLARPGFEPPTFSIDQLDWLPLKLRTTAKNEQKRHFTPGFAGSLDVLSERNRDFIKNGASVGERNYRLFCVASDMAGNAFSFPETFNVLEAVAIRSGLSKQEILKTIRSAYSKAREPAKPHRSHNRPAPHWQLAQVWAQRHHWDKLTATDPNTGKPIAITAINARKVFIAVCERARVDGQRGVFRASSREVAELARCTQKTANKALKCLAGNDYIKACGYAPVSGASLWAFGTATLFSFSSQGNETKYLSIPPQWSLYTEVSRVENDAFERGALGANGERVWRAVLVKPLTVKQLAQQLGLHVVTVRKHLRNLHQHGMVEKQRLHWSGVAFEDEGLDMVAADAGKLGAGERRRAKHQQERSLHVTSIILRKIYPRHLWNKDDFLPDGQFGRQLPLSANE